MEKERLKNAFVGFTTKVRIALFVLLVPSVLVALGMSIFLAFPLAPTLVRWPILAAVVFAFAKWAIPWLLAEMFVEVPAYHYGVREVFGKRARGVVYEGLAVKFPKFEKIPWVSMELKTLPIEVVFTTKDLLQLTVKGSLQYRADAEVLRPNKPNKGTNVFVTISDEAISEGLVAAIKAKIGALGGVENSDAFIGGRHALSDFINVSLRLGTAPHRSHSSASCGVVGCSLEDGELKAADVLAFYKTHHITVKAALDQEKKNSNDRSGAEMQYGVDIEKFELADVAFTKETQAALEEKKQVSARATALTKMVTSAAKLHEKLGIPGVQAFNYVQSVLQTEVPKQIISVEGAEGLSAGLIAAATINRSPASNVSAGGAPPSKKEKSSKKGGKK